MPVAGLPLRRGADGEPVRDVQQRLAALGFDCADEPGTFGAGTEAAVRAFQSHRGLRADGVCGRQTWSALVEAGYRLGDRLLFLRQPMLRGDDVASLQHRLGALGFDPGKVDGTFGPQTALAVEEFQRNVGLPADGVCGPSTITALERIRSRCEGPMPVAAVREIEALRGRPRTLHDQRVMIGDGGGAHALVTAVTRLLVNAGARAVATHHPDPSEQAAEANRAGADVFVGLLLDAGREGCRTAYYSGHRYESPAGKRLAALLQQLVVATVGVPDQGIAGMRIPVLLETRMPAVVTELGPPSIAVERTAEVARAVADALERWAGDVTD